MSLEDGAVLSAVGEIQDERTPAVGMLGEAHLAQGGDLIFLSRATEVPSPDGTGQDQLQRPCTSRLSLARSMSVQQG